MSIAQLHLEASGSVCSAIEVSLQLLCGGLHVAKSLFRGAFASSDLGKDCSELNELGFPGF